MNVLRAGLPEHVGKIKSPGLRVDWNMRDKGSLATCALIDGDAVNCYLAIQQVFVYLNEININHRRHTGSCYKIQRNLNIFPLDLNNFKGIIAIYLLRAVTLRLIE